MHQGKKTFGSYGTFCFSGTLKMMCNNTFNLEGNHFNVMKPNFNLFNCHPNCLSTSILTSINLSDAIVIVCNYNNTSTNNDGNKMIVENSGFDLLGREINLDKHQRCIYFKRRNYRHINKYLQLD